ncbi:MAG: uroporphyrinogen-III synthase [Halobacteriota archaeon]
MKAVAIIRPKAQLSASRELAESYGYDPIATSLIEVESITDPRWLTFSKELNEGVVDYVVLTSANGVHCSTARGLYAYDIPAQTRVVAIGPHTKRALHRAGIRVDLMPVEFSSEGVLQLLQNVENRKIWLLRSAYGSSPLLTELSHRGAVVNEVTLYTLKRLCGTTQRKFIRNIVEGNVAAVLFTSSMTVQSFFECALRLYDGQVIKQALRMHVVGAIGRPTAEALRSNGVNVDVVPKHATFADLMSSVHGALINRGIV